MIEYAPADDLPGVQKLILAYIASFSVVFVFLMLLGFGPLGVGAGSSFPLCLGLQRPFARWILSSTPPHCRPSLTHTRHSRCGLPVYGLRRLRAGRRTFRELDIDGDARDPGAPVPGYCCLGCHGGYGDGVGVPRQALAECGQTA